MSIRKAILVAVVVASCGKLELGSYPNDESDDHGGDAGHSGTTGTGGTASLGATSGSSSGGTTSLGGAMSGNGSGGRGGVGGDPGGEAGMAGEGGADSGPGGNGSGGDGQAGGGSAGTLNSSCRGLEDHCVAHSGCCASKAVGPEEFTLGWDQWAVPASVSLFYADVLEVTVGRFVNFVEAYDEWRAQGNPTERAGEHPLIEGSGWQSTWTLPVDHNALKAAVLDCGNPNYESRNLNVEYPMNCVSWYVAFAFCIWDGKRLFTQAEWELAAKAGSEERRYPWGDTPEPNPDYAVYGCLAGDGDCDFLRVGSVRLGDSREGLSDLGGSVAEWIFDAPADRYPNPCNDCATLTSKASPGQRGFRGGGYSLPPSYLVTTQPNYTSADAEPGDETTFRPIHFLGFRCARSPDD